METQTVQWFYERDVNNAIAAIHVSSPYDEAVIDAVAGPKNNRGKRNGGVPLCTKRFSDAKYWVLTPNGKSSFAAEELATISDALVGIRRDYNLRQTTARRPNTERYCAKNAGLHPNFTGAHKLHGLLHYYQDGTWMGCNPLPDEPISIPERNWLWSFPPHPYELSLSPSALNTFRECPFKWFLQRMIGLKDPTKLRQHVGHATHAGCEDLHTVIAQGTPLQEAHLRAAESFAEAKLMDPRELAKLDVVVKPAQVGQHLSDVRKMLQHYFAYLVANPSEVAGVEEAFTRDTDLTVTPPGTTRKIKVYIEGRIDLRYRVPENVTPTGNVIADVKTSLSALPAAPSKIFTTYDQITTYALLSQWTPEAKSNLVEIREVHPIEGVRVTKIPVQDQLRPAFKRLGSRVRAVTNAINSGCFERNTGYHCGSCAFLDHCFHGMNLGETTLPPTNSPS